MLVLGHDHGNMAVGSIVLSVVPIGKLIGTRKSDFAGTPPLPTSTPVSKACSYYLVLHVVQLHSTTSTCSTVGGRSHTSGSSVLERSSTAVVSKFSTAVLRCLHTSLANLLLTQQIPTDSRFLF